MFDAVKPVSITAIESARGRIAELGLVSPLVACDAAPPGKTVLLKLENCRPSAHSRFGPSAMQC